jgi:hypothetical protein
LLSASCLQPNGIAASDFARGRLARPKNCAARSRGAEPSSSPKAAPSSGSGRACKYVGRALAGRRTARRAGPSRPARNPVSDLARCDVVR